MTTDLIRSRVDRTAVLAGAIACCLIGASVPLVTTLQLYPAITGLVLRYLISLGLIAGWMVLGHRAWSRPNGRDLLLLASGAAIGMIGFNVAVLAAAPYAEPGLIGALVGVCPVLLAVAVPLVSRSRPAVRVALGAFIVTGGVMLLSGGGSWHGPGLPLAVVALLCETGFTVLIAGPSRRQDPGVTCLWLFVAALAETLVLLVVGHVGLLPAETVALRMPTPPEATAVVILGAAAGFVAFMLWSRAVNGLGVQRAGTLLGVAPVAAVTVAIGLGSQDVRLGAVLGGALVALGCIAALWTPRPEPVGL